MKYISLLLALILSLSMGYYIGINSQQKNITQDKKSAQNHAEKQEVTTNQTLIGNNTQSTCNCATKDDRHLLSPEKEKALLPTIFKQLLTQAKYTEAINLYHNIHSIAEGDAEPLKQLYIQHLRHMLEQPTIDSRRFSDAIDSYLADFYSDIDVLLIQANYYIKQNLFYETLSTFQLAQSYALDNSSQERISSEYNQFMILLSNKLAAEQQWDTLVELYSFANSSGLLTETDRYLLIEVYLIMENEYQAQIDAERLLENPKWDEKVANLFKKYNLNDDETSTPPANDGKGTTVALIKNANQFIVPVSLPRTEAHLLIDTGASITTFSKDYYQSIRSSVNMKYQATHSFLTANGKTSGEIYILDKLVLGDITLNNVQIAVLDFPTSETSNGLLGMNVLQQFQFEIDQDNSQLNLKRKD